MAFLPSSDSMNLSETLAKDYNNQLDERKNPHFNFGPPTSSVKSASIRPA